MQTLGLSNSNPASENRLKSLFWPSIQTAADVDYLGAQGYWICALVAVISAVFNAVTGHAVIGVFIFVFYFLGGVGVREHSRYAAAVVLILFVSDMAYTGPSVLRIILAAVLLSNLRATWIASSWQPGSSEASLPPRLSETWGDKFVDKLPMLLWPKVRILYYVLSACLLLLSAIGLVSILLRRGA
jgi:hypothetical protein